jgi:hypothetical protein
MAKDKNKSDKMEVKTKNDKKPTKEKVLSEKEQAKKLEKERAARRLELKKKQYEQIFSNEKDLVIKQKQEKKNIRKSFIISGLLLLSVVGLPFGFYKLVKNIKRKKLINNPYKLRTLIIIEDATKKHNLKNDKILEAYKKEKKRIKTLKRLPYKILNSVTFLLSMFSIILFFFVLDVGIEPTALIIFGVFTLSYFVIGLLMHLVFYMLSENKERELMLKLESEKNRLLAEEKLKNEDIIRNKIEKERRRCEEEERLRIEEAIRAKKEQAELEIKMAEEQKLMAMITAEKQKLLKQRLMPQELLPPPTQAELAQETETLKNEFDRNTLKEIEEHFGIPNISGIEDFTDANKIKDEYSAGAIFPDEDISANAINMEIDNMMFDIVQNDTEPINDITNFDITDIEEAKTLIFEKAKKKAQDTPKTLDKEDKEKSVSGKSFMVIKQMLKDD